MTPPSSASSAPPAPAAPTTIAVSHPSASLADILGAISQVMQADAPVVVQVTQSPQVAIGFAAGELAITTAQEIVALISALKKG